MRGPGYRHDLDVRRVWQCAKCGKQRRLPGDVTAVACACGQPMQLIEHQRRAQYAPQPLVSRELTVESFALTEEELARPVAARPQPAAEPREPDQQRGSRPPRPSRRPHRDQEPNAPAAETNPDTASPPESAPEPVAPLGEDNFGAGIDPT